MPQFNRNFLLKCVLRNIIIYLLTQFRLLAELVKSYGSCAALITEHVFESGMSDLVKEDTTALAFLLDELLVSKSADKECSNLIKTLVAALASCNHFPEAQSTLVMEVKGKFRFCCFLMGISLNNKMKSNFRYLYFTCIVCIKKSYNQ